MTLSEMIWKFWALITNNAVASAPPLGVTSRLLVNVWAMFSLVFIASYTANLAAFMIQEVKIDAINSVEELMVSSDLVN